MCGKLIVMNSPRQKHCDDCNNALRLAFSKSENRRFSGLKYENSKERLEKIKEKYKNGVRKEILENFWNFEGRIEQ